MKRLQQQKGFTLVELAIVLTIIGLLIGGILKGQALIANARVTAQMAQIKGFEAAITTFNDTYSGLPGDLATATTRIPNCVNAAPDYCFNGGGAGVISAPVDVGPTTVGVPATIPATTATSGTAANFWIHLAQANLISGVAPAAAPLIGTAIIPSAKVNSSGGVIATQFSPPAATPGLSGLYLTITMANLTGSMGYDTNGGLTGGTNAMTPSQAAQIDRKMDDGNPTTGNVIGYGDLGGFGATGCLSAAGAAGIYEENNQAKSCGLNFYIQ